MPQVQEIYYSESPGDDPNHPVIVLIHGAGGDHHTWPVEMRRLAGWRILALDLPGHGRSPGRPRQTVAAYARDLVEFLDALKLYRVALVGHALGAAVTLQLALEQPDLVVGLGLISAGAHFEVPPGLVEYFTNPLTASLGLQLFQKWAFSPQTPPARVEAGLGPLRAARPAVLAGDWQASAAFDLSAELPRIYTPAWVAAGGDDRLAPLPCAHFLSARLPTARLQVIPAAGHMLPVEKPAELAKGLRAFLADLTPFEQAVPGRRPAQHSALKSL